MKRPETYQKIDQISGSSSQVSLVLEIAIIWPFLPEKCQKQINQIFVKRSQYIRTKNPFHKQSEKAYMCF